MTKAIQKQAKNIQAQQDLANLQANANRARSVAVGTAFGGTTELSMRANDGSHLWCIMQPVEVIELIHQLAANVGCHIHIQPRKDFSSWRDWRVNEEEKKYLNGWSPFANDLAPLQNKGRRQRNQEHHPELLLKRNDNELMAIEKAIKRRSTKRAATTS